jgi:hypothetical protein
MAIGASGDYANIEWANYQATEKMLGDPNATSSTDYVLMVTRLYMRCQEARGSARLMQTFCMAIIIINIVFLIVLLIRKNQKLAVEDNKEVT